jgi:glucosyl-dolichyl phosphate glucuronosyltransferase
MVKKEISVVVCAHDEKRWGELLEAIDSLARQTLSPLEVIVVIDFNPRLLARARNALPRTVVVENVETRGLGGARNSGVRAARGSIVAFLDDDAVASPRWLELLARAYNDPTVAGAGGSAEPAWVEGRPGWFPQTFDWVVGCTFEGMPSATEDVRNLIGCNMTFRRDLLLDLGLFQLGYGCDETELCIRLRHRWPGRRLLYVPDAKVFHRVPPDRTTFGRFLSRCYFEGGSKAVVAALVGAQDGLASERRHARSVLPRAATRGLKDFLSGRDARGLARAGAIVAGLASATAGYVAGSLAPDRAARRRGWGGNGLRARSADSAGKAR